MPSLRVLVVAILAALAPYPAGAQVQPRTCGILDGPGCNPNQCGVLDGPGCIARAQSGVGESLQLTLGTRAVAGAKKPARQLNTIGDLFAALRACWAESQPTVQDGYPGMQMSLRFSLNREGTLIAPARVTYASHDVSQKTRDVYRDAFEQSLRGCVPFPLTRGFAGAIAGRPIALRIIEDREEVRRAKPPA